MAEYIAAKSAGEMICKFLEKNKRDLKIYCPRFPRVETDQTLSLVPVRNEDPLPVLIEELRNFNRLYQE